MTAGFTILALDLATITGWACGADYAPPRYNRIDLGKDNTPGKRMSCLRAWLDDFTAVTKVDLIVFEAPIAKMQTSARGLIYLAGAVEMAGAELGIPYREEMPQTARKLVLGKAAFFQAGDDGKRARTAKGKLVSETKSVVTMWAQAQGWQPQTHDVADALLLLRYAHIMRRSRVMAGRAA